MNGIQQQAGSSSPHGSIGFGLSFVGFVFCALAPAILWGSIYYEETGPMPMVGILFAIASGVVGVVFAFASLCVGLVLSLAGFIVSLTGLRKPNNREAIAGVILSMVGPVTLMLLAFISQYMH